MAGETDDDNLPPMSGRHIRGTTTARGKPGDPTKQLADTPEEIEQHAKQVVGMLLFDEHKDDKQGGEVIGVIRSAKRDAEGRLEVDVEMADTVAGWTAMKAAEDGDKLGFSWSRTFGQMIDPVKGPVVVHKTLNDLSIVARPEFEDDALIHHIDEHSSLHKARKEKLGRLIKHQLIEDRLERLRQGTFLASPFLIWIRVFLYSKWAAHGINKLGFYL